MRMHFAILLSAIAIASIAVGWKAFYWFYRKSHNILCGLFAAALSAIGSSIGILVSLALISRLMGFEIAT